MSRVHLSFDNGPHPEGTPLVLSTLAAHGVKASFFVLGQHLATPEGRALACRVRDAGHRLGNHSYTHRTPLGQDPGHEAVARELEATQGLLEPLWPGPRLFRPFGGGGILGPHLLSTEAVEWLSAHAYTVVLWNAVPRDWEDPEGWVETAMRQIGEVEHALVVLHDAVPEAMRRLDGFLEAVKEAGHTFTEDWPRECLPMVDGVAGAGLVGCVVDSAGRT